MESIVTFEQHVRPILKTFCFDCHGESEKPKGKLDLRLRRLIVTGGRSGSALVPGQPEASLLYERIIGGEMPPRKKKLSKDQVEVIRRWIASGAGTARQEPAALGPGHQFTDEERAFWSFQPIRRPAIPRVRHADQLRTPIDAFLLTRLEEKGLSFSPEANKLTLLRRVTFDLLGLPPSSEEMDLFLADTSPDAYERLIDRLLSSPHYGERWGRHWLDVAGYADSEGYTSADPIRPDAYRYRDYVVRALNADRGFDRFVQEQLAGDEMVRLPYRDLGANDVEKLAATGFLRMAPDGTGTSGVDDVALARNQVIADTIKIVSTALLGLSVGCAQCHDHRYDPIPQQDYYRLRAIFEPAYDVTNWDPPQLRHVSLYTDADRVRAGQIEQQAAKIDGVYQKKVRDGIARIFAQQMEKVPAALREQAQLAYRTPAEKRTPDQNKLLRDYPSLNVSSGSIYLYEPQTGKDLKKLAEQAVAVRAGKPAEEFIRALTEIPGRVPTTHLFFRGDHREPRQAVAPGELTILARNETDLIPSKNPALPTTGRRLAYARWLTSGRHPLVARVLVNRVWLEHFGRGLVGTPADFGIQGERPSHPELLDWLAAEFIAKDWSLKHLHKLIVTSRAYRQTARRQPAQDRIDPDNRLLARMNMRRLEAEAIRDGILAISGRLSAKFYGPPVAVHLNETGQCVLGGGALDVDGRPGKDVPLHGEEFRRSVYVQVRRSMTLGVLETFDAPAIEPNCELRSASTVPPQALMFMNSDFVLREADAFARRLRREAGADRAGQVRLAWRHAFGVEPSAETTRRALAFLADSGHSAQAPNSHGKLELVVPEDPALASFCQAILGSSQFLYVD